MNNCSLTRNLIRLTKTLPVILGLMKRYENDDHKKDKMSIWRTVSDIMLFLYFITDHPFYFQKIGLTSFSNDFMNKIDYWNNIFWFLNSVFDIICDIGDLKKVTTEIKCHVIIIE